MKSLTEQLETSSPNRAKGSTDKKTQISSYPDVVNNGYKHNNGTSDEVSEAIVLLKDELKSKQDDLDQVLSDREELTQRVRSFTAARKSISFSRLQLRRFLSI